jgi:hypothetical protein
MRSTLFWDITQRRVVIGYRRFGTTYPSHRQGWRSPRRTYFWPLKMGPIRCPETSVKYYQSPLCNIPEERRSQRVWSFAIKRLEAHALTTTAFCLKIINIWYMLTVWILMWFADCNTSQILFHLLSSPFWFQELVQSVVVFAPLPYRKSTFLFLFFSSFGKPFLSML